ncbi:CsbD family protein [Granulicella aggregans]|uniref:CsbD family protein n=1 Tax=Granulicella aggregans TaxID=474949 RepID=UPI0021E0E6C4|nr:CsbD family protein [Granulicella aggregans]
MNKSIYLLAGAAAGAAAIYLYFNAPSNPRSSALDTASDAIGDATAKATAWGAGQRVSGSGTQVLGKVKQSIGEATGNDKLANEGVFDQAKGMVKDAAGQAAHAAVNAVRELNR